jgi:hypothetical protein
MAFSRGQSQEVFHQVHQGSRELQRGFNNQTLAGQLTVQVGRQHTHLSKFPPRMETEFKELSVDPLHLERLSIFRPPLSRLMDLGDKRRLVVL